MRTDIPMKESPYLILLVEDSETQALALQIMLEEEGWIVSWVPSAEKALEVVFTEKFDLIIVDYNLPRMRGDELCRQLKLHFETRSIPIVMLTIEDEIEMEKQGLRSGADVFIPKHADRDYLMIRLQALLSKSIETNLTLGTGGFLYKHCRILAVDDSPTYLEYVAQAFEEDGITIEKTTRADNALKLLKEQSFDCVLVDLIMPNMNGIELCQHILEMRLKDQRPIVVMMLTAHESKADMKKALEAGADDFVGKSNDISIIKTRLSALLRRKYIQEENQRIMNELKQKEMEAEKARFEKEAAQARAQLSYKLQETVKQLENEIQERKRIANELQIAKEVADAASRAKSEFLSNMSHELRSPLNSMLLLSELLADNKTGNLTADQVEMAQIVHASGKDLLNMIDDLLDLSKVEAAKMVLQPCHINLQAFVEDISKKYRIQADSKNLTFTTRIGEGVPVSIISDPQRLTQIIRNLLSNAIKFTESGSVKLEINRPDKNTVFSRSDLIPDKTLRFSVTDTGIGIAASKQELIFQSFTQADGSTSRKHGGSGLGLTIAREFSRFLGGEIQLISEETKGSSFVIYLPQTLVSEESAADSSPAISQNLDHLQQEKTKGVLSNGSPDKDREQIHDTRLSGIKLLLVDDDMRNVYTFLSLFKRYNIQTIVGENGKEGLDQLSKHPDTDIIIMDIMMPVMDGYEAIEAIRSQDRFKNIPIIALTAKAMINDREKCLSAGANEYLAKPVHIETLINTIKDQLASPGPNC